ncbi:MAG: flavodoxin [Lachnospiraceae bacterium]|nr:flavodoxin [Lachnospiraceae bacterium]
MDTKTAIVYYSAHHGNTKRLLDAIKKEDLSIKLIDVTKTPIFDLSEYKRLGVASGIYYSGFSQEIYQFMENNLPAGKQVFALYTAGILRKGYTRDVQIIAEHKKCVYLGEYGCRGYDTMGPIKFIGGINLHHPTQEEILKAVIWYRSITPNDAF